MESAARALAQMCTTLPLAMSAIDKAAIPALAKVLTWVDHLDLGRPP